MSDLVLVEQGADLRHEITHGAVIGRDAACEITVADDEVSRRHAQLRSNGSRLSIEDLGSVNGTFVNGSRLSRAGELRPGDTIQVGGTKLSVATVAGRSAAAPEKPAAAPPPREPGATSRPFSPPAAGSAGGRRSAATRSGATIASYATILATAVAVAAYLAGR